MKGRSTPDKFNERLATLLKKSGLTQKELAQKANVTESSMSHYLKGDRHPRASVVARIAEALNTSTDYLLGESEKDLFNEISYATQIIARNAGLMTKHQKMEIIDLLISGA